MKWVVLNSIPGISNTHTLAKCISSQSEAALSEGLYPDAESTGNVSIPGV